MNTTISKIAILRREVLNYQRATEYGQCGFDGYASRVGTGIHTCRYHDLAPYCDTLAIHKPTGRHIMTRQNMVYFPYKVEFVFTPSSNDNLPAKAN